MVNNCNVIKVIINFSVLQLIFPYFLLDKFYSLFHELYDIYTCTHVMLYIPIAFYNKKKTSSRITLRMRYAYHLFTLQLGVVIDLKEKVARSSVMSPVVVSYKA